MNICHSCRIMHVLQAGMLVGIMDIVEDRLVKQHRILRHDTDIFAQAGLGHITDILAINQDTSFIRLVEAEQ